MSIRLLLISGGYFLVAGIFAVVLGTGFRRHRLRRSLSAADYDAMEREAAANQASSSSRMWEEPARRTI